MVWDMPPKWFAVPRCNRNLILCALLSNLYVVACCIFGTVFSLVIMQVFAQALSVQPPYTIFFPDQVVLRALAAFLPMVVTSFHNGQSVTLKALFAAHHPSKEERLHWLDLRPIEWMIFQSEVRNAVGLRTLSSWLVLCINICYTLAKKKCHKGLSAHPCKAVTTVLSWVVSVLDIARLHYWHRYIRSQSSTTLSARSRKKPICSLSPAGCFGPSSFTSRSTFARSSFGIYSNGEEYVVRRIHQKNKLLEQVI